MPLFITTAPCADAFVHHYPMPLFIVVSVSMGIQLVPLLGATIAIAMAPRLGSFTKPGTLLGVHSPVWSYISTVGRVFWDGWLVDGGMPN